VTQTEQTVNRLIILLRKRRNQVSEIEDFGSARWAVLLTIQHRLRRGFDRKKRSQNPNACDMSATETNIDVAAQSGYRLRLNSSGQTCPD
jgi:hypothetical protein